jgi:PAS domain S-box-containing protein
MNKPVTKAICRIVLPYVLFAGLWILLSDWLLEAMLPDPAIRMQWSIYKGWAFVLVTALLLAFLLRVELQIRERDKVALRESEERLRLALDAARMGTFDWDVPHNRINWSRWHEELWGMKPGEFGGTYEAFSQRLHPDDLSAVNAELARCIGAREVFAGEFRVVWPDGSVHWIASTGQFEFGADGRPSRMRGTVRETTERKRTEEILQESEIRYRFLFEHNPMPMLIYERGTLQMLAVNEAFLQHYGYRPEEALALRLTDLYPEEEKAKIVELITRLYGHANVGEWRHRKHDGSFITIVASSHDLEYQGRSARVAVMTDITERKRAEEELQAIRGSLEQRVRMRTAELAVAKERAESADQLKSAFLATMSHELRTPLNSIIGFTGIMLQGLAGGLNAEQTKQLGMVQSSARHLLALINDVLDISKIEAGQLEIHAEEFDLRASLEKVALLVKPLADKKGLALRVALSPDVEQAVSDRLRVEQVLLNLLNNAVKFTERGEVTLEARLIKGYVYHNQGTPRTAVRLDVTDTGIGIKPEDMEKIFQPFRQIDSGLTRQHEGTGLGLTICRRLADLLGGEISARSTWGEGSVFTFILPLKSGSKP